MILPSTYLFTLILLAVTLLCWGSWATTFKSAGKWRFELYSYDFAVGVLVATLILGLTFGMLGWDGFSLVDDVRNAGKRQEVWGFLGGCVFSLANMLLLGSVSLAGLAVGFPIAMGIALVIGTTWNYVTAAAGNPILLSAGCVCILIAVVVDAMAFKAHSMNKLLLLVQQGKTKSTKKTFNAKGIFLAMVSGVLLGLHYPLIEMARQSEIGVGPYALAFVFAAGILFSTFVYNLFLMNLPVAGKVIDFSEYFKGSLKAHYLGISGGMLWATGAVASLVAARAEGSAAVTPALTYAAAQGSTIVIALWGLIVWREFNGADSRIKAFLTAMLVLFIVGLGLVTAAPFYNVR